MTNRTDDASAVEFSSPACSMHEADDTYSGYASKDELVTFLNELLEAEHAGARVTLESARAAGSGAIAELMRSIQRDEAHWCGMLADHLRALGASPSPKIGAFYRKAMAIADLSDRIDFLNRGEGWVVRKLRELLPRVRDNQLHKDLTEMLRSHEANIDRDPPRPVNDAGTVCLLSWSVLLLFVSLRCQRTSHPEWLRLSL